MIPELRYLSYEERLKGCDLTTSRDKEVKRRSNCSFKDIERV